MITATKEDSISSMKNTAQNFRSAANDVVEDTKKDLQKVAGKASRSVRDFMHSAGEEITHAKDTVTTQIRSNPIQSSAIALGVGIVLGALLRR